MRSDSKTETNGGEPASAISRPQVRQLSRRSFLRTLGSGLACGAMGSVYVRDDVSWVSVEERELRLKHWDAEGFRLVVLADLHVNSEKETRRAEEAVQLAIAQKPDLVTIAGDFLNIVRPDTLANVGRILKPFGGQTFPTVAVLGNHDYWSHGVEKIIREVKASPVKLLRNQTFEVSGVTVAGVDDAIAAREEFNFFPKGVVSKSLLGILHEPDYVAGMPEHVSLQISGHSHGGQICLPFGIPVHTPFGARNYIVGFYPDAPVPLYVNRGIGTTGPSYRLFCRPEVSVLTLRSA